MLLAFSTTLIEMLRIFALLLIGYAANKLHILPKDAGAAVSRLVTMLFLPALLLHTNMTEFDLAQVANYSQMVLIGVVLWFIVAFLSAPVAKLFASKNPRERGIYLYGLTLPNTGAVGTPLALALLGTTGLYHFTLFILINHITCYAWGVNLFLETERKNSFKRFLINMLNPVFISMMIGLTLGACGARNWMPQLIIDITADLSSCYVPVSLLMTGYTIADYPLGEVFGNLRSYVFTALRLVVIPVFALAVAWVFGVSREIATLIVLTYAGPCGMNVVVFPASYRQDCKTGVSMVLLSSLGAIITVPILYAVVQQLFS